MSLDTAHVLTTASQGATVVHFHLDGQGIAALDPVRHYFATTFLEHTAPWSRLVVDLSGVATLDSSCLGPLVQKLRQVQQAGGRMALTGVHSPALEEILALTRFDKVFPITRTRDEAVALVKP